MGVWGKNLNMCSEFRERIEVHICKYDSGESYRRGREDAVWSFFSRSSSVIESITAQLAVQHVFQNIYDLIEHRIKKVSTLTRPRMDNGHKHYFT